MPIPQRYIKNYFRRFADRNPLIDTPINPLCKIIIVIPCFNEPNLIETLDSLFHCHSPECEYEVIIVVNQSTKIDKAITEANQKTIKDFEAWNAKRGMHNPFYLIKALDLPHKTAGVGLARKIGMDEALRRFESIDENGAIACLDADCTVSENYLRSIEDEFCNSDAGIGHMRYEHPFELEKDKQLREGIINYELFLRYYVEGLRQARFPNAIHTVGSCMLVKAAVYAKHGGMNKRKAGEDFYFLHKIVPHEEHITVNGGMVFPSCRTSDRVPFGTGKAQQNWLNQRSQKYMTYDPLIFQGLRTFNVSLKELFNQSIEEWLKNKPEPIQRFLIELNYSEKINSIKSNSKTVEQFRSQFYVWFDGFLCMKYVHFVRDRFYPNIPLITACQKLKLSNSNDPKTVLETLRLIVESDDL